MVAKTGAASGLTFVRKFPRKLVSVLFLSKQTDIQTETGVCGGDPAERQGSKSISPNRHPYLAIERRSKVGGCSRKQAGGCHQELPSCRHYLQADCVAPPHTHVSFKFVGL